MRADIYMIPQSLNPRYAAVVFSNKYCLVCTHGLPHYRVHISVMTISTARNWGGVKVRSEILEHINHEMDCTNMDY